MKRPVLLLFILILSALSVRASGDDPGEHDRKKVGLVLSGGGAKGVAHIGVLKVLEEAKIPIDYIAGTSMGAIIGGLYSIGYTPAELDSMVRNQNWNALLSDQVSRGNKMFNEKERSDTYMLSVNLSLDRKFSLPSGVVVGQNVLNFLTEMTIGYHDESLDFNMLPIPFAAVSYDMVRGEQVVFRSGNLATAIRASMSIPGAFAPVYKDSMVLVDGGIYNNFPVDIVREMGADIVIGVDISSGPSDIEELGSIVGIINQITTILGRERYNSNIKNIDLCIRPDIKPYTSASFYQEAIDSLILRGERAAQSNFFRLMEMKDNNNLADVFVFGERHRRILEEDSIRIGPIHFIGLTGSEESLVRMGLGIDEHGVITKEKLNETISRLRGSGAFSYVTYTLNYQPPYDLNIFVNEQREAAINIGFRFDSEEMAGIMINSHINLRGWQGPQVGVSLRLNNNPYVRLDFTSRRWMFGRLGVSYMFRNSNFNIYDMGRRRSSVAFAHNRIDAYFMESNLNKLHFDFGVRFEHFNYDSFLFASNVNSNLTPETSQSFFNYQVGMHYENLDNRYFPSKGVSLITHAMLYTNTGFEYNGGLPFGSFAYDFKWAVSLSYRFAVISTVKGRTLIGNDVAFPYLNYIGGSLPGRYVDQQMSFVGIRRVEEFKNSVAAAALEARYLLLPSHYVSLKGEVGIQNGDFFEMFNFRDYMWGVGLKYSYDTAVGPLSITFARSNISRGLDVYVSFGKYF